MPSRDALQALPVRCQTIGVHINRALVDRNGIPTGKPAHLRRTTRLETQSLPVGKEAKPHSVDGLIAGKRAAARSRRACDERHYEEWQAIAEGERVATRTSVPIPSQDQVKGVSVQNVPHRKRRSTPPSARSTPAIRRANLTAAENFAASNSAPGMGRDDVKTDASGPHSCVKSHHVVRCQTRSHSRHNWHPLRMTAGRTTPPRRGRIHPSTEIGESRCL